MRLQTSLTLPTEARFVPVARRFVRNALREFGVDSTSTSSICLALTEACANAVEHSKQEGAEFEVSMELQGERCVLEVSDQGVGFENTVILGHLPVPDAYAERGRGLFLMQALVDDLHIDCNAQVGTTIRLEKRFEFAFSPLATASN